MKEYGLKAARIIGCLILSVTMVMTASILPDIGQVNAATDTTKLDSGDNVLNADKNEPSEMKDYPDDVYNKAEKKAFLLSEQNELAIITGSNSDPEMYCLDNINMDPVYSDQYETDTYGVNLANSGSYSRMDDKKMGWYDDTRWIQSVGVDWNGTGRKEYIASVGYVFSKDANYVTLAVQNAATGSYEVSNQILGTTDLTESDIEWLMDNYIAITAGDYDCNGRDSVVVYFPGKSNSDMRAQLVEVYRGGSIGSCLTKEILDLSTVVKNTDYLSNDHYKLRPVVGLTTGDFNGDGHDQLAYSAGFYNTSDNVQTGYRDFQCTDLKQFATCIGVMDCSKRHKWSSSTPLYLYDKGSMSGMADGEKYYPLTIMHAGQIAAGDVDNNGLDEIVAAGYTSLTQDEDQKNYARAIYVNGKLSKVSDVCNWSDSLVSSVISYNGTGYERTKLETFSMPAMQKYTFNRDCREEDWGFTKLAMACGKTNGNNSPEEVFIAGYLYDFQKYSPSKKYNPYWFGTECQQVTATGADYKSSSVNWVRNVTTGNFNGNDAGREQFVYTFWQKVYGEKYYSAITGSITGAEFDDDTDDNGVVTSYGAPTIHACGMAYADAAWGNHSITSTTYKKGAHLFAVAGSAKALYGTPVAVDIDDDGILGRFSKKGYIYSDPEVLAVLEAGPYFKEIDAVGGYEDPCQTYYNISSGYGTGSSRTGAYAFEVGLAAEASGPGVKASLEAGYTQDWSKTLEESYSVTTTSRFSAQSHDIVVINRIPHLIYTYDIWDAANNNWIYNGYSVKVPLSPRYYTLSIKEYNSFVDKYNTRLESGNKLTDEQLAESRLKKIVAGKDIPKDHEGNPDKYWENLTQAGEGRKQLSGSSYALGHSSGSQGCEYTTEAVKTESEAISHGVHFSLTLQGGGSYVVGEAWAGAYANVDYSTTTGHSVTQVDAKTSGGQVQNIKASSLKGNNTRKVSDSYKFRWEFIKWTRQLNRGASSPSVPFYGYTVSEVKRLPIPVQLDDISMKVDTGYKAFTIKDVGSGLASKLSVKKKSGSSKITYDKETKSIKVAAGLERGKYEAVFRVTNGIGKLDKTFKLTLQVGKKVTIKKGSTYKKNGQSYKVTVLPSGSKSGTVAFTKASNITKVTVPATIKLADGKTYRVTRIDAKAFTGKKIRTVIIGKYVKTIKKYAFKGSGATKLIVKTKRLTKDTVKGSLKGSKVKTIQVSLGNAKDNKTYVKKYSKIFTKTNAGLKATVK